MNEDRTQKIESFAINVGVTFICCMIVGSMAYAFFNHPKSDTSDELTSINEYNRGYRNGVSNALDCLVLLNLEQQLYDTNRTWGAMCTIVRSRLGVN